MFTRLRWNRSFDKEGKTLPFKTPLMVKKCEIYINHFYWHTLLLYKNNISFLDIPAERQLDIWPVCLSWSKCIVLCSICCACFNFELYVSRGWIHLQTCKIWYILGTPHVSKRFTETVRLLRWIGNQILTFLTLQISKIGQTVQKLHIFYNLPCL